MKAGKYFLIFLMLVQALLLNLLIISPVHATNDYALKTGKGCIFCHQESTGGPLKSVGFAYIRNSYQYPKWEFYELWHHEGRRARMGAAMMAPDYAWWHGFYELKHRFNHILKEAGDLKKKGRGHIHTRFPGKYKKE